MKARIFTVGILFAVGLSGCASLAPRSVPRPVPASGEAPMISAFVNPLPGSRVISPFGSRGWNIHDGVDLQKSARGGDVIVAARDGTVETARRCSGYGLTVVILHPDGSLTRYAHLKKLLVEEYQEVTTGQQIGIVGATGRASAPHLHFEVLTCQGHFIDPFPYLQSIVQTDPPGKTAAELPHHYGLR